MKKKSDALLPIVGEPHVGSFLRNNGFKHVIIIEFDDLHDTLDCAVLTAFSRDDSCFTLNPPLTAEARECFFEHKEEEESPDAADCR